MNARKTGFRFNTSHIRLFPLFTAMLLSAGCGGGDGIERVAVSGKVSFEGKPVEDGFISFYPIDSGIQSGARIVDGEYQAVGRGAIPVGKYQVRISWLKEDPSQQVDGMPVPPQVNLLPAKYDTESELTLDVSSGQRKMTQDYVLE
jgi:hypothetical protein